MPPNGIHESVSLWLMEQSHRTQHALGEMRAGLELLRREGADGRKALHHRINETRQELTERLDRIEKKEAPPKGGDWSWIKAMPLKELLTVAGIILAGLTLHLTPDDWREVFLVKMGVAKK